MVWPFSFARSELNGGLFTHCISDPTFSSSLVSDIGSFSDLQSSFKSFRDLFVMDVGCNSLSSLLFFTGGRGEAASFISVSFLGGSFGVVPPPLGLGLI